MKISIPISFYSIIITIILISFGSCQKRIENMYLNSEAELIQVQNKVNELAGSLQIDSVSIRSTNGQSLMSSIYILGTDEGTDIEYKTFIEFIPREEFVQNKESDTKKDALHSSKLDLKNLFKDIETAKTILPSECKYKDVKSIRYSANPFGNKYYFELEVEPISDEISEDNEYIDWYNTNTSRKKDIQLDSPDTNAMNTIRTYVVLFTVENDLLEMIKIK